MGISLRCCDHKLPAAELQPKSVNGNARHSLCALIPVGLLLEAISYTYEGKRKLNIKREEKDYDRCERFSVAGRESVPFIDFTVIHIHNILHAELLVSV